MRKPPLSSKEKGKAEERAPSGDTPMARFRLLAKKTLAVRRDDLPDKRSIRRAKPKTG